MNEKKEFKQHASNFSDRQSVRTTFRLSKQANEALGWLAQQQKVTMKDVLDASLEILGELSSSPDFSGIAFDIWGIGIPDSNEPRVIRKTLVLTRGTLKRLKLLSEKLSIPRDVLIDKAILYSKKQISDHEEDTKEKHQKVLEPLSSIEYNIVDVMMLLDEGDPIKSKLGYIACDIANLHQAIKDELEKGIPIDPDDL
ncbi:MAG: hypothetical protein KJ822_18935 [Proteobacteria bacterium]|nr:hypothetical protein [Pseudomonadota bacterium]MBU4357398.1 hypothetical protein [Pseudomonadota bacterium]